MVPRRFVCSQRSDQFSFCVTLWEFVYGQRPFVGDTVEQLLRSMAVGPRTGEPAVLVPTMLHAIMLKGLALDPDDRYASMDELLEALSRVPRDIGQRRRKRVVYAGWLVAMFVGGVGGVTIDRAFRSDRGKREDAEALEPATKPATKPPVDKQTSEAEQARLEAKYDAWVAATEARMVAGADDGKQSLTIAHEFYDTAVELEATDKASALAAADYAEQVSTRVETWAEDPTDVANASNLRNWAASMVDRLDPQSKHSTVPSILE